MKPIDFETTDGDRYSVTPARDYAYPVADPRRDGDTRLGVAVS